jgi:predicted nucleotidyltransferase
MDRFGLPKTTRDTVRTIFSSCAVLEKAVLYGSRAKGNYKPGSDIDLTLIGPKLTQHMLSKLASQLEESAIPYQVDLSIHADIDNPNLLAHIARVGVVFYERGEDVA